MEGRRYRESREISDGGTDRRGIVIWTSTFSEASRDDAADVATSSRQSDYRTASCDSSRAYGGTASNYGAATY